MPGLSAAGVVDSPLLSRGRSGTIWLAADNGLWRRRRDHFERVQRPDATQAQRVQAIAEDGSGAAWISVVRRDLYRLVDGHWQPHGGLAALGAGPALVLADDRDGRLWAGYPDDRVAVVTGDDVRHYGLAEGLQVGHVLAIYGQRHSIWVGGDVGLARFDGQRFQSLRTADPGALRGITGIVESASGDVWLNASVGIVRIPTAEVARAVADPAYRASTEILGTEAGLEGTGARIAPLPTLIEGSAGVLWASTSVGVYSLDPHHVYRSPLPPVVSIQSFTADDNALRTRGELLLPPHTSALHISYAGVSLTAAEKVRFRVRLDGVDKDWRYVQAQHDAFYMNLGPGSFRFRVQATIGGVPWNDSEAVVGFTIEPAFVQTHAFIALCVIGVFVAMWLAVRIRVAQVSRRLRIGLLARANERERIARELHDTLLQSMQGVILQVHAVTRRKLADDPERAMLEKAMVGADAAMAEGRDRIQELRTAPRTSDELHELMKSVAQEMAFGQGIAVAVLVEGDPVELDGDVSDEAFRLAREALSNAFCHAGASLVQVIFVYGDEAFQLRVCDNGRGIDAVTLNAGRTPGHWGLPGMLERARRIGGQLEIKSAPGNGTEVELAVPVAVAYSQTYVRRWWGRRRHAKNG